MARGRELLAKAFSEAKTTLQAPEARVRRTFFKSNRMDSVARPQGPEDAGGRGHKEDGARSPFRCRLVVTVGIPYSYRKALARFQVVDFILKT